MGMCKKYANDWDFCLTGRLFRVILEWKEYRISPAMPRGGKMLLREVLV